MFFPVIYLFYQLVGEFIFISFTFICYIGIYHRFTPDEHNFIRARRLFVGEPVWTPINRPIGDEHPSRQGYVQQLQTSA